MPGTNLPKTAAFFEKVQKDAAAVTDGGKDFFKRPRPYTTDPSLANGKLEKSFSYPSGHSTESMVLALVLADLLPDKHDAIIAEARTIGWHRVQIARHYPTDIYAGRVLARAIVKQFKKTTRSKKILPGSGLKSPRGWPPIIPSDIRRSFHCSRNHSRPVAVGQSSDSWNHRTTTPRENPRENSS